MHYEWDQAKNRATILKRGVDFADIPPVFDRPMLIEPDERKQYGEDRWIGLGMFPNGIGSCFGFYRAYKRIDPNNICTPCNTEREEEIS